MARRKRYSATYTPGPTPPEEVPEPTRIKAAWYPATVSLPGEDGQRRRVKVFAAPEGLYVYETPPADGYTPAWHSPIDYEASAKPPTGWRARNGFTLATTAGAVTITANGGCGCGHPLRRWNPEFAKRVTAW